MTAKEYLSQACRLDLKIDYDLEELARLREITKRVAASGYDVQHNTNRSNEAPFTRGLERVWELEQKIDDKIDKLVDLKEQISEVIGELKDANEQMVLTYRYLLGMSWREIGAKLYASEKTVRRWHGSALKNVKVPDDAIII